MNPVRNSGAKSIRNLFQSNFVESLIKSSKSHVFPFGCLHQNPRAYVTKRIVKHEKLEVCRVNSDSDSGNTLRLTPSLLKRAQAALLEYFYCTRALHFGDAENMSKNAPCFLEKILRKIDVGEDIGHSFARFLRFHPINEFEPFFESIGLEPSEYGPLLPRDKMFLSDDELLLENNHILYNYGIPRDKMGKIFKEAKGVFKYDTGVLQSKLQDYHSRGLSQSFMSKVIVCSPSVLVGDTNMDFLKVLERLRSMGLDISWVEEQLLEQELYRWSTMHRVLSLFDDIGFNNEELGGLICRNPGFIFESSGDVTLALVTFYIKVGLPMSELHTLLHQFPKIHLAKFFYNTMRCLQFLNEIEMKADEIGKIVCFNPLLIGTCTLKKTNSILSMLNVGKKRLCQYLQENPQELKTLVLGSKAKPLPDRRKVSKVMRIKFLLDLGYLENSEEMDKAVRVFRGKGTELQERFDFLMNKGLNKEDVAEMVRVSPQILNQSKDALEEKIDYLLNELGYPISALVDFPSFLNYTTQRNKLRFSMYTWLRDEGKVEPDLALSTFIACSDKYFMRQYVMRHPSGPKVWEDLKAKVTSE